MGQSFSRKSNSSPSIQVFPALYLNRRLITMFTATRHLAISWIRAIQFAFILFLSYISSLTKHLHLCLPNILFPLVFHQQNPMQTSLIPSCVTHSLSVLCISFCSCLQPPITSSFLTPNIFISILFSYSPNLCSFCNLNADFHTHITREKSRYIQFFSSCILIKVGW